MILQVSEKLMERNMILICQTWIANVWISVYAIYCGTLNALSSGQGIGFGNVFAGNDLVQLYSSTETESWNFV